MSTRKRFEGRVALITGASRGQGRSHAVRFAEEGADVITVDLLPPDDDPDGLAETVRMVQDMGRRAVAVEADVRDEQQLTEAVDHGVATLGRLDVAVANAGVLSVAPSLEETSESWQRTLDVNVTGAWHTCRAALPHLLAAGSGAIVLVGSTESFRASAMLAGYAASKHAVTGLAKSLAAEFAGQRIRVNSVHPTTVWTPMFTRLIPPGLDKDQLEARYRPVHALPVPWIEPVDVSNAVLFLASDEARYITGAALPIDAGALLVGGRPGT
ncbi:mycofactocin-coupled SDR family oxidoreductase [Actinomadura mexicana]|uniref:(+)-trans-carveol dehydrogenase/(-)-trans-carveol dehydrogenase n=1 Tax=Actinomadura mexicana TaxID=134959 RepID=A0A238XFR8_9ACTN|nr:mycofactocin-coupled SDR family oxidoreductase [Actinomadura mexicana]SNR57164.1 (+)-trans-carveol dehydrogenase/(-)-trans-carveol dehydrogenase [Actinomadura mexicana]